MTYPEKTHALKLICECRYTEKAIRLIYESDRGLEEGCPKFSDEKRVMYSPHFLRRQGCELTD